MSSSRPPVPAALPLPVVDNHAHLDHTRGGDEPFDVSQALVAAACGVSVAVYGGVMLNAISNAARTKGCFAASYGAGGPLSYNSHSSKCKA